MGYLKKALIAVVTACLALLLIGPASALADRPLPAPPWDDDPSHWTAVEVTDCHSGQGLPGAYPNGTPCSFVGVVGDLLTKDPLGGDVVSCEVTLEVDVWSGGETRVNDVQLVGGTVFPNRCAQIAINNLPWDNQICERIADDEGPLTDHQYWDALEIDFTLGGSTVAGTGYFQLADSLGMSGSGSNPLDVDSTFAIDTDVYGSGPGGGPPDYNLSDPLGAVFGPDEFSQDRVFTVDSLDEEDCLWEFPEA